MASIPPFANCGSCRTGKRLHAAARTNDETYHVPRDLCAGGWLLSERSCTFWLPSSARDGQRDPDMLLLEPMAALKQALLLVRRGRERFRLSATSAHA
jgi:hypothetical protein